MKMRHFVKKKVRVEMMPLIDAMFLLLVFFIYAMLSMVLHKGVDVNLPQISTIQMDREDYDVISITDTGELFWNKERVTHILLCSLLQELLERKKTPHIYISADKNAKHLWVMDVMDLLRESGIKKMFFELDKNA